MNHNQPASRADKMITPNLSLCFDAGSLRGLFPLLADWNAKELRELRRDLARYYRVISEEIEASYRAQSLKPENVMDPRRQRLVDHAYQEARIRAISVCTEIHSVISFYLETHRQRRNQE
jgi:hypothetical protein